MPDQEHLFDIISDADLFGAREWQAEHLRVVTQAVDPPCEMVHLDGRHEFWMHPTAMAQRAIDPKHQLQGRVYAVLRIDARNRMVSGDLFTDYRHRKWIYSWTSEAVFVCRNPAASEAGPARTAGWQLLVLADVHKNSAIGSQAQPPEKIAVAIRRDERGRIGAVRIVEMLGSGRARNDLSLTDDEPQYYDSFRRIALVNLIHTPPPNSEPYGEIIGAALGEKGEYLRRTLRDTGSRIYGEALQEGGFTAAQNVVLEASSETTELELLSHYQWTDNPYVFAVLLTTMEPNKEGRLGVVLGLDGSGLLHKSRFGAVVYVKEVVDGYLEREQRGGIENYLEHLPALARRIRHFYIHELGHMMNLPHPWQRDEYAMPSLPANPAARSWMNYGSRFPLGLFMDRSRTWASEGDQATASELKLVDSERNADAALFEPGFTAEETRWLHHAPFNHFTPGGRYYTEQFVEKLKMNAPTTIRNGWHPKYTPLKIDLWDRAAADDGYIDFWRSSSGIVRRQSVFGEVTFRIDKRFLEEQLFHFTFQAPMLLLLVRSEYPDGKRPDATRTTRVAPVVRLPFEAKLAARGADLPQASLGEVVARVAVQGEEDGKFVVFRRFLPLLRQEFFDEFAPKAHHFTAQAVLRTYPKGKIGQQVIFSNKVRIRFSKRDIDYSEKQSSIVADSNLPLLLALLAHSIAGHRVEDIELAGDHKFGPSATPLTELANKIRETKLADGQLSSRLFAMLQERINIPEFLDKILSEGYTEFNRDSYPFHTPPQELKRFLSGDPQRLNTFDKIVKNLEKEGA
ncbi:MAG: hypothetical protein AAGB11_17000 [Pseudomonadota bacterium]